MARATTKSATTFGKAAPGKGADKNGSLRTHLVTEFTAEARRFSQLSEDIAPAGQGASAYAQLTVAALLSRVCNALERVKTLPATYGQLAPLLELARNEMEVDTQSRVSPEIFHTATAAAERAFTMAERRLASPKRKMRLFGA